MQGYRVYRRKEENYICCRHENGKRTAKAAVKIAVDMFNEGIITKEEALLRVEIPEQIDQLLHRQKDTSE